MVKLCLLIKKDTWTINSVDEYIVCYLCDIKRYFNEIRTPGYWRIMMIGCYLEK
jgi:hypothetical protein